MNSFPRSNLETSDSVFQSNALSGGERNRLFMHSGGNFKDVSLVSGVDFREDGRGFVLFDYDSDGFLDIGVSSPNAPRFRIAKNRLAEFQETKNTFVEVQLVGGQNSTASTDQWSSRDPFGACVLATIEGKSRMFQLTCGEGLSVQNSKRIHIGMRQAKQIDSLEIIWPSGKTTTKENIAAGQRITVFENPK